MRDLNIRLDSDSVHQQLLFEQQDRVSWDSFPAEIQDVVALRISELLEHAVANRFALSKKDSAHE